MSTVVQGRSGLVDVAVALSGSEPAFAVSAAMSDAVDARTVALITEYCERQGPPPSAFAWMALGSHARRELHCASDQDHALVWAEESAAHSSYARELAESVIAGLSAFGMRPCSGYYMADRWSHSLHEWLDITASRIDAPTPDAVLDTDIFLDLRVVAGDLDASPIIDLLRGGAHSQRLLHGLAQAAGHFGVPLTAFSRLPHGSIDLKKSGLAPVVLLARLYGLVAGATDVSTRGRLAAAASHGALSAKLSGKLDFAYTLLTRLRLHSQLRQISAGEPLSDVIAIEAIPWQDQGLLRTALRSVRSAQSVTAVTYRTDL
jgi:CBS domain-containing protein